MSQSLIILQLSKIPGDDDYLGQIMVSPRGTSGQERFVLADANEVFQSNGEAAQTLAQLKAAIDSGDAGSVHMERLGEFLYTRIFAGLVERKLRDVMIQEKRRPYRLCIRIDENAPLLETIPWEYMKRPDGFIALSLASITRVLEDRDAQAFDTLKAVKILVVYANPTGYVSSENEKAIETASNRFIDQLEDELKARNDVNLAKLLGREATRQKFLDLLANEHFDIVHFIGHGEILKSKGHIVMHDGVRISGEEIYYNLSDDPPRLFYFNSCSTAKASTNDSFSSVAQALIRPEVNSVPAVVAMQYRIEVNDSLQMAQEFYQRLLDRYSATHGNLEAAMDAARRVLRTNNASWGIPVLFLQTQHRVLLFGEVEGRPPAQLKQHLNSSIRPAVDLVNREVEVSAVRSLLAANGRLLVVTGLPGVGRGSIVRKGLDEYLRDAREEIPIWLNLEGIKPDDAALETLYLSLDWILETGLKHLWHDQRRPLEQKLAELVSKIPNTAIIVLENLDALLTNDGYFRDESVEQLFFHFGRTSRRIFCLVTSSLEPKSRSCPNEWGGLWQVVKVPGLKPDDGLELLRRQGLAESEDELRRLVEAVDGHPETLEIIAAGIKAGSIELRRFLTAPKVSTGLTGYFAEAMMASLTGAEATALRVWSVFRNPMLRVALTEAIGDISDAERVVDSLCAKGLLNVKDGYYFLPSIVRSVANDELKGDLLVAHEAHGLAAAFFIRAAKRASDELASSFSYQIENERINDYLEACYHLRERSDYDSRQRAIDFELELLQALMDMGRFREMKSVLEQLEQELSDDFTVQIFKAQLEGLLGDYRTALDRLAMLDITVKRGSLKQARVANEIGVVLKNRSYPSDAEEALSRFNQAYDIFANLIKTSADQDEIETAYHSQAVCTYDRGLVYQYAKRGQTPAEFDDAYRQARRCYESARQMYQGMKEPDDQGIALALSQLGELLTDARFADNNPQTGEEFLRSALSIAQKTGNPRIEAHTGYQLARFLRHRTETVEARALLRHVADVAEGSDLRAESAIAEVQIAEIDFQNRQYNFEILDAILARNEETLGYYEDLHSIRVQSDAYFLHGLLYLRQKNIEHAKDYFENSRSVMRAVEEVSHSRTDAKRIARATSFLAQILLEQKEAEAAQAQIYENQNHFAVLGYQIQANESLADFLARINEWRM